MKFNYYENLLEGLENLKSNNSKEDWDKSLKEDIDPKTNDADDLYAVWITYVGKRVVNKDTMIGILEEQINKIKKGTVWNLGEGLAFRCIQVIDNNEPLVPNRDDDDFLKNLDWKD